MLRPLFLLELALLAFHHGSASGCSTGRSSSSLRASFASKPVGARIDVGAELRLDQYPYEPLSDRRYFRALVRRVIRGCNELEKHEDIIISVPAHSATSVIGDNGALTFDLMFGSITSMTFPAQGTTQVLALEDACQAYVMANLATEDRDFLRDQGSKCFDAAGYPSLRGGAKAPF